MTLRNKFISASLAAAAFVVTPSPVTQGQANGIGISNHVDRVIITGDETANLPIDLSAIDTMALAEVERIASVRAR